MQTSVVAPAEVPPPAPSRRKSLPTVRTLLFKLILVCLLPALLGAGIMIYMEYERGRTQQQQNTYQSVHDKLDSVDAQLTQAELFAQTLAINGYVNRQDFATFHQRSVRLLHDSNLSLSVILYDASGQQLLNTNMPYGAPLPKRQDLGQIQSVFATGRMIRSTVISRTSDGHAMVGIMAPVFSGPKVVYALAVGFAPAKLNSLLALQLLEGKAIAAIIDSNGTIAARSHKAESFIGQKADPELRKQLETHAEGIFELTPPGENALVATYARSPQSGWTVVIATPSRSIETPLTHNLMVLGLGGVLLLGLSLGSAWFEGNRIAKSLRELRASAVALGTGALIEVPAAAMIETNDLSQALQASARSLIRRTQQLLVANETLQERSSELTEAQHIAKMGNWKWHASTGSFFASDELLRLYGRKILLPFDAQKGKTFPDAAWEKLRAIAKAARQTETGFSLLLPTLTNTNTQIWARVNGEIVRSATGEVSGLRGTLQNIDVDVKAEMALQDSANRYRTLFDGSPEAIIVHLEGAVALANAAAITLFNAAAEPNLTDVPLRNLVHPDFHQALTARQLSITQLGESVSPVEMQFITLKGITFSAQVRCTELIFEGKRFIQTYIRDLTEQKRRDAEISHLQSEMHQMLTWQVAQHTVAALAHEVNQPLASANFLCEAAKRMLLTLAISDAAEAEKSERLKQTLQRIASDIERAGSVLRNLLKSVNQPDITRSLLSVNELVAESVQTALHEGVFGYRLIADYAADLPNFKGNHLQVTKVLLNLIHNGAEAMQGAQISNGTIWISTALAGNGREICVSVRDEGPGISDAMKEEVFQPFITTKSYGLGMGLTINRALIEAHGGKLWHTQEGGLGATFRFTLPIAS